MKKNKKTFIKSADSFLLLEGDANLLDSIVKNSFLQDYIPNMSLIEKNHNNDVAKVIIEESDKFSFSTEENKQFKIKGKLGKHFSIVDIITMIDYCLETVRQENGIYCIHGSASCARNKAVLLIGGASGIGKSKVNYFLVKNNGFQFIADEKILINKRFEIVGGIKKFIVNKDLFLNNIDKNYVPNICIKKTEISFIIQPITTKNGEFFVDYWDKKKINFHMYEELSRKIRGISRRINNFSIPLQSLDIYKYSLERSKISQSISKKIKGATIYGDPEYVANFISKRIFSS